MSCVSSLVVRECEREDTASNEVLKETEKSLPDAKPDATCSICDQQTHSLPDAKLLAMELHGEHTEQKKTFTRTGSTHTDHGLEAAIKNLGDLLRRIPTTNVDTGHRPMRRTAHLKLQRDSELC